jgi:DNA-binding transcriptional LysR family regulator
VLYQHDKDTLDKLTVVMRAGGAQPPNVVVVTTSLHAVMQFLKSGPYLACLADAYLRAMPEPGVAVIPFRREIWSFPSGALYHDSVRNFAPISTLVAALHELAPDKPRKARTFRARRA